MDVEQLQIIVDAMQQAGEGAFWIAVLWLGQGYLAIFLWFATALLTAYTVYRVALLITKATIVYDAVRSELSSMGVQITSYQFVTAKEMHDAFKKLRRRMDGN